MKFLDDPWGVAETAVFKLLCEGTGTEAKRTAFLGFIPPSPNVWALKVGGGDDVRNTWTAPITELHMAADIEGVFLERADARKFALKVLALLPLKRMDNVQVFRLRSGGMPDVKITEMTFANETAVRYAWSVSIGCEIVFNTVERANADPVT